MGPFEMLAGKQQELLQCFRTLAATGGVPARERVGELLEALGLHLRLAERHLQPLVARVEGAERACQETEILLTLRELMDELALLPRGSLGWQACLGALEDVALAHVRSLELQLFPRLASALEAREQLELVRALAATREALHLERRGVAPSPGGGSPWGSSPGGH